jgi:hypothetical protein
MSEETFNHEQEIQTYGRLLHAVARSIKQKGTYMNALVCATRRWARWSVLLVVLALAVGCGTGSGSSTPAASPTAAATTGLAPDPNAPVSHCLLGGKPLNIDFNGVDANNMCTRYVAVLANLGLPNLPVHANTTNRDIPDGISTFCHLSYPLSFGTLYAMVNGYPPDVGDAGSLDAKVCAKLKELGWVKVPFSP